MNRFLIFSLSSQSCGFPLAVVEEILPLPRLVAVPGMPSLIEGYFNLGGEATVVLNLNTLLGLPKFEADVYCPLICLKGESFRFAVLVHRVSNIATIAPDAIRSTPVGDSLNGVVTGLFSYQGESVSLLSSPKILLEKERLVVGEFSTICKKRLGELG